LSSGPDSIATNCTWTATPISSKPSALCCRSWAIPWDTLNQLHQNLNILREREAKYGGSAPLELLHQFSRYNAPGQTIRLHDVIRHYLIERQPDLPRLHRRFLEAYRPRSNYPQRGEDTTSPFGGGLRGTILG
jgi:hypothetical protein